jgi:phospholipase/carboxylesterase
MVPFRPDVSPRLDEFRLFLSAGRQDPIVPVANTLELTRIFETAGAEVSLHWHIGGHQLGQGDIEAAAQWLTTG